MFLLLFSFILLLDDRGDYKRGCLWGGRVIAPILREWVHLHINYHVQNYRDNNPMKTNANNKVIIHNVRFEFFSYNIKKERPCWESWKYDA